MIDWLADAARYAEQWLDYQIRSTEQPGCVLAIAADGAVRAERAFGVADIGSGAKLTPQHRFRVASHSKTFTSAGIMKLREEGRLHLDDPVGRHVANLAPAMGEVTIAQLLSHSAGIGRDGLDANHWQDRQPFLDEAGLGAALREPLTIDPNTRFKYSNLGFGLLGSVIEAITGEPYVDWINRHIVAPAGLTSTSPDMPSNLDDAMATGHGTRLPAGRRLAIPGRNPTNALAAATGFVSTAGDLARFFGSLDPAAKSSVLTVASRREMTRRHWRIPHPEITRYYGLGTIAGTLAGHDWFGHSGAFQGFISRTACVPEWGVTISIVTNAIDGPAAQWIDGILTIMHQFSRHGAAAGAVADWAGRWWSYWGALDLVPMGSKVLTATPAMLTPFSERSEIEITGPNDGRIQFANGFGSHGERVHRARGADGRVERLLMGGIEMLPEEAMLREIESRRGTS